MVRRIMRRRPLVTPQLCPGFHAIASDNHRLRHWWRSALREPAAHVALVRIEGTVLTVIGTLAPVEGETASAAYMPFSTALRASRMSPIDAMRHE